MKKPIADVHLSRLLITVAAFAPVACAPESGETASDVDGGGSNVAAGGVAGSSGGIARSGGNAGARASGGSSQAGAPQTGGASNGGASNGGAPNGGTSNGGASNGAAPNGGASNGGASNGGASNGGASNGGASSTGGKPTTVYPPGPPGCGLAQAAFCDTFDRPAGATTRAGELDPKKWSASRFCDIGGPEAGDQAVAVGPATMPACRADLSGTVLPNHDAVICDATNEIHNNHLLVLAAAQNYGQNSYRIRQPFDFANRTGTVVFDAQGYNVGLQGWVSVEVTEDPAPAPSFTLQENYENGSVPRNGVEIQLNYICNGDNVGIYHLLVYKDFHQDLALDEPKVCVPASAGKLNHFEVKLSKNRIEVYATPPSNDGVTFGSSVLLGAKDIDLPFSRGYVHITTHNHASLKYSNGARDSWAARWDNVGFDGPAITSGWREYEALDSLTPATGGVNVGWRLAKDTDGPAQQIEIKGVDVTGAVSARLAVQNWSYHPAGSAAPADYALNYRLNGHAWKSRKLTPSELQMMTDLPNAGTRSVMLDVDVADLVNGTNTIEFTTTNAAPPIPALLVNVDLILQTG
jgi:hypothetical protein